MDSSRKTAYYTLMDVENKKSYSNLALNHHIICGKPESPAFVRELVYGVLENKYLLDHIIDHFVPSGVSKLRNSDLTILRMGLYQIGYMESVPAYAAVNESVDMAKKFAKGREGFINGVLRSYLNAPYEARLPDRSVDELRHLSIKYSYEPWIIQLWMEQYKTDFVEDLLRAGNETPDLVVRVNTHRISREDMTKRFKLKGVEVAPSKLAANALRVRGSRLIEGKLYKSGLYSIQDESSILAVEKLDPQPGEFIIDVCAAPGGKTLAIAEAMRNSGRVLAQDIYRRKLNLILKEAKRLGLDNIEVRTWDGTRIDSTLAEKADRVIVDAPCSGLGVIRRKPEIKYKRRTTEMDLLPRKQLDILSAASTYVRPGGILMYCTCTINPNENQRVIRDFLKRHRMFEQLEMVQLLPNVNDTDGFFVCRMKKADRLI